VVEGAALEKRCGRKAIESSNLSPSAIDKLGGVAEWLNAAVLKTVVGASPSRVRILPPPLNFPTRKIQRTLKRALSGPTRAVASGVPAHLKEI
jgi:hypothetical protein